jgi:hypothetical protein
VIFGYASDNVLLLYTQRSEMMFGRANPGGGGA